MVSRDDFGKALSEYLAVENYQDYCPNGLQVAGKESLHKVATTVSVSIQSIAKAIQEKCDALIVHHGLFWKGDPYPIIGSKRGKLAMLLEHGLSLFAYHLPLDGHQEIGNNWSAARGLGWKGLASFQEIGVRGEFPETNIPTFVGQLEKFYGHPATKALGGKPTFKSAALISGGAYREMRAAIDQGVDCFITGNFDEPAWHLAHEEGIHFFAMGHAATERIGVIKLASWIQQNLGIEAIYLQDDNPF